MTDVFWMTRERDICRRIMIIGLREIRYESNHREFSAPRSRFVAIAIIFWAKQKRREVKAPEDGERTERGRGRLIRIIPYIYSINVNP